MAGDVDAAYSAATDVIAAELGGSVMSAFVRGQKPEVTG
jgi:hypothetical protein